MRVVVAPDKFKGSLTAKEACLAIGMGIRRVLPDAAVICLPMADGGEGTVSAALRPGDELRTATVHGPLGDPVEASWILRGTLAILELAGASGLQHVAPSAESALRSDSYGTGELIKAALDAGAAELVIGIGGSACTDGGSGALKALGLRLIDAAGEDVPEGGGGLARLRRLDARGLDPRLQSARLRIACDVKNPLLGHDGAAAVYGPQKGAGPDEVTQLGAGLDAWAAALEEATGREVARQPGSGAAGGFPSGFLALTPARIEPGFELLSRHCGLNGELEHADLVIVGEGSLDSQSMFGKVPVGVALEAQRLGVDAIALAGRVEVDHEILRANGILHAASIIDRAPSLQSALGNAAQHLEEIAAESLRLWAEEHRSARART